MCVGPIGVNVMLPAGPTRLTASERGGIALTPLPPLQPARTATTPNSATVVRAALIGRLPPKMTRRLRERAGIPPSLRLSIASVDTLVGVHARAGLVAEHRLRRPAVGAERVVEDVLPRADVADLAVAVVVPAGRRIWIGDR